MFLLALTAAAAGATVTADPASAEIFRLEQEWGKSLVTRDFNFLEGIIAPEYRLVGVRSDGKHDVTRRADWMKNARAFRSLAFEVETLDVNRVGNTAVASAQGVWTVSRKAGETPRATRFFVTDTWVHRHGKWQVIHRFSQRIPSTAGPPVMPVASQPK